MAVGRHLRLSSGRKVVIGRHERENEYLGVCGVAGVLRATTDHPGPTTLVPDEPVQAEIELAARITTGYSDGREELAVRVEVRVDGSRQGGETRLLTVAPMPREKIKTGGGSHVL